MRNTVITFFAVSLRLEVVVFFTGAAFLVVAFVLVTGAFVADFVVVAFFAGLSSTAFFAVVALTDFLVSAALTGFLEGFSLATFPRSFKTGFFTVVLEVALVAGAFAFVEAGFVAALDSGLFCGLSKRYSSGV